MEQVELVKIHLPLRKEPWCQKCHVDLGKPQMAVLDLAKPLNLSHLQHEQILI